MMDTEALRSVIGRVYFCSWVLGSQLIKLFQLVESNILLFVNKALLIR